MSLYAKEDNCKISIHVYEYYERGGNTLRTYLLHSDSVRKFLQKMRRLTTLRRFSVHFGHEDENYN